MKKQNLSNTAVFLVLAAAILLFFPEIVLLKKGFVSGDHRLQHYPWFILLGDSLRQGALPWWTSFNQCGFPLLAEGQIAAFYPLQFIFAGFFPVNWGYNYAVLAHYFLGGAFFYLYARKIGMESRAALWAAVIFLFGSCQGGFFYNIPSQRVLIWFPLSLYWAHRLVERKTLREALTLGLLFALEALAGYQQYAVYATGFAALYLLIISKFRQIHLLAVAVAFSLLVASPQWVPFLELSRFSSRAGLTEAFAYIGSMNPAGPLTLFFPSWQGILGAELYAGILGLFFAFLTLFTKKNTSVKIHGFFLALSLLLAWGGYSPLYIALIKITHFYGFRIPVKFLFFAGFSLAVLSGWGMQALLAAEGEKIKSMLRRPVQVFAMIYAVLLAGVAGANLIFRYRRDDWMRFLEGVVETSIVGKPYRPHSEEVYFAKLQSFYELLLRNLDFSNLWLLVTVGFTLLSLVLLFGLLRTGKKSAFVILALLLLYADFYAYGYRNVRGDYENFSFVRRPSDLTHLLKRDTSLHRIHLFTPGLSKEDVPLESNANIAEEIQLTGLYSPFAFRGYRDLLGPLGSVDDSLASEPQTEEALAQNLDLLRFLNVKYVISSIELDHSSLKHYGREGDLDLYELEGALPRFFFVPGGSLPQDVSAIVRAAQPLMLEKIEYDSGDFVLKGDFASEGFLVTSELNYPGWQVRRNKKETMFTNALELFKAVQVERGVQEIQAQYRPRYLTLVLLVSAGSLLIYFLILCNSLSASFLILWMASVLLLYLQRLILPRVGGFL